MVRDILKIRVRIWHDDGTVEDLTDRVISGPVVTGDIDAADWECSMLFDNSPVWISVDESLDPADELSVLNLDGSSALDPILSENHKVQVDRDEGSGWVVTFQGYAGSVVESVAVSTKKHTVRFSPFGVTMPLKERDRLTTIVYENRDLATSLLQSLMLDSGMKGKLSHVVVIDDPSAQVTEYTAKEGGTLWSVLQEVVAPTGYILASRHHASGVAYNDGSGESTPEEGFYVTLLNPVRDKTVADHSWTEECVKRNLRYSIDDVRTAVQVQYEIGTGARKLTSPIKDEAARAKFGTPAGDGTKLHRWMRLVENNNSLIRNKTDAETYQGFALHDLSAPQPSVAIDLDELWSEPELNQLVSFAFTDYTLEVGITGIRYDMSAEKWGGRTTFTGAVGRVIGLRNFWLSHELTDEERQRQRIEWLEGGMAKLPAPRVLSYRRYTYQTRDGQTWSAMTIHWERCKAWWYGHTAIYVSYEDNRHYPPEPFTTSRGTFTTLDPLPAGVPVYFKLRNFPATSMSPQGRR